MYTIRELLRRSTSVRITVFEQHGEIGGYCTGAFPGTTSAFAI
ncbi:ferredoxin--NADP(+) reductase [Rhodococcus opacus RKJ300 = JCM 13270]|uniref:Ferredoxin--NADP(+) reductase n=1 Tax=Rhodococcus opacus RKJ300 = JCM 13270 TaxID=1165867 RepID=I0WU14_RHOOP|nr:ferredoxin--NADP(+) reductase [Rhodococcus opacus RKJ300 = JCM 13270]